MLIATKLFAPRPRPGHLERRRLLDRLAAGLAGRCTLLAAAAGYGKTSLLAAWVGEAGRPVAWLSLDERDQDVESFLRYLVAAVRSVAPACGATAAAWLDAPPAPPPETVLTSLLNDLAGHPDPCLLVLDDYHAVRAPAVHAAVAFLLDHLPPGVHLAVSTREDPPLPVPRLRARGQVVEIRAADLRFTPEEAAAFLAAGLGLRVTDGEATALHARTEGWAAGLQLAGLALRDHPDPVAFVAAFAGGHRLVTDYLTAEVLDRQPAAVRRFLLATSPLDRFSAPLCDAVLAASVDRPEPAEPGDSQRLLEDLERAHLFVVPLDDERRWYRYHHLFADALRARLAREPDAPALADIHRRASGWFERNGLQPEAIHHALAAGDGSLAARLIGPVVRPMQLRGEQPRLMEWLAALPEADLHANPPLAVAFAWGLATTGRVAEAARWLAELEPGLLARGDANGRGQVHVVGARLALITGDYARAVALAHRALAELAGDNLLSRALAHVSLGSAAIGLGDLETAGASLARASEHYRVLGSPAQALLPLRQLARVRRAQGRLNDVERTTGEARRLAAEWGKPTPLMGYTEVSLGELRYERNNLADAERHFADGVSLIEPGGVNVVLNALNLVDAHVGLARVRQARGDLAGAVERIQQADAIWRRVAADIRHPAKPETEAEAGGHGGQPGHARSRPNLIPLNRDRLDGYRVRFWLQRGDLAAARRWAADLNLDADHPITFFNEAGLTALARVLLAQGQHEPALALLDRLMARAEAEQRFGRVIELLALTAPAMVVHGRVAEALAALDRALALAEPEGFCRTFVDEGPPMAALLRAALPRTARAAYVAALLAAFEPPAASVDGGEAAAAVDRAPARPGPVVTHRPATAAAATTVEPLTARELDVLRLLAAGRSNAEIARELVVERSTVKTHLIRLYGKLGVHSRTQALARARALHLVD